MPLLKNRDELNDLQVSAQVALKEQSAAVATIFIGMGTCGIAAGASDVAEAVRSELAARDLDVEVIGVGCIGMCVKEPLVDIQLPGKPRVTYANVKPEMVGRIIEDHLMQGKIVKRMAFAQLTNGTGVVEEGLTTYAEHPFYSKQIRIALRNCGVIDPESITDYFAKDGYQGLAKVLFEMDSEDVIDEMKDSGLRGRGGAGFLTGVKWEFCMRARGYPKYVICNADEGDPGAFMDRSILEGDPHAVIEGMIIAGYAIGAP